MAFTVVRGKHTVFPGSRHSGCVTAIVGGSPFEITSSLWPFDFDYVVNGLSFTATLDAHTHPRFGPQYRAKNIRCDDTSYAQMVTALGSSLTSCLNARFTVLLKRFGPSLFAKLQRISDAVGTADELIGGKPLVTIAHVKEIAEAYDKHKDTVQLSSAFPPIDSNLAVKYMLLVKVNDIRNDPYVLYWRKPDGRLEQNPLHLADDIARQHLEEPLDSMDVRRISAYFWAAVKKLQCELDQGSAGSVWFTAGRITHEMLALQGSLWGFDAQTIRAFFLERRPLPPFVVEDDGLFARARDAAVETSLGQQMTSIQSMDCCSSALRCLECMENVATHVDEAASIEELESRFPRWRMLEPSFSKCDPIQRSAARILVERRVLVLMGGAGTGKSTTLAFVVRFARIVLGVKMVPCALTGKAVDRLRQLFDDDDEIVCRTLHSQVANAEYDPAEALAIDEASMAYPDIVQKVLRQQPSYLVICGDDKQLPSINPGAFLRDVVASDAFSILCLERIYRSGPGSGIATEAPRIFAADQLCVQETDINGFRVILEPDLDAAISRFGALVNEHGADNVAMISNVKRTCKEANKKLQPLCNERCSDQWTARCARKDDSAPWIVGDRLISHDNIDTVSGERIFNGMMGKVHDIRGKQIVTIFQGSGGATVRHVFSADDKAIDHAYCITTWKYQGSEIKAVVVFFDSPWCLSCELLYTSITRGQESATLYISSRSMQHALATRIGLARTTRLAKRIKEAQPSLKRPRETDE